MPENPNRTEVSLAIVGSGGAGVMATGELLCALSGLMTKSYGPQIRGGESACFLRLGRGPFRKQADEIALLIVLDWRNIERFREELTPRPGAWILYEKTEEGPGLNLFQPATRRPIGWKAMLDRIDQGKDGSTSSFWGCCVICWA
jgi:2-oxoglutarate ferredoxin oxidoreductase subunit alpha